MTEFNNKKQSQKDAKKKDRPIIRANLRAVGSMVITGIPEGLFDTHQLVIIADATGTRPGLVPIDKVINIPEGIGDAVRLAGARGLVNQIEKETKSEESIDRALIALMRIRDDGFPLSLRNNFKQEAIRLIRFLDNLEENENNYKENVIKDELKLNKFIFDQIEIARSAIFEYYVTLGTAGTSSNKTLKDFLKERGFLNSLYQKLIEKVTKIDKSTPLWHLIFPSDPLKSITVSISELRNDAHLDTLGVFKTQLKILLDLSRDDKVLRKMGDLKDDAKLDSNDPEVQRVMNFKFHIPPPVNVKTILERLEKGGKTLVIKPEIGKNAGLSNLNSVILQWTYCSPSYPIKPKEFWKEIFPDTTFVDPDQISGNYRLQALKAIEKKQKCLYLDGFKLSDTKIRKIFNVAFSTDAGSLIPNDFDSESKRLAYLETIKYVPELPSSTSTLGISLVTSTATEADEILSTASESGGALDKDGFELKSKSKDEKLLISKRVDKPNFLREYCTAIRAKDIFIFTDKDKKQRGVETFFKSEIGKSLISKHKEAKKPLIKSRLRDESKKELVDLVRNDKEKYSKYIEKIIDYLKGFNNELIQIAAAKLINASRNVTMEEIEEPLISTSAEADEIIKLSALDSS